MFYPVCGQLLKLWVSFVVVSLPGLKEKQWLHLGNGCWILLHDKTSKNTGQISVMAFLANMKLRCRGADFHECGSGRIAVLVCTAKKQTEKTFSLLLP